MTRAILIVLDSVGCGGAEDAKAYGDEGADTLGHIAEACALGRGNREGLTPRAARSAASRRARPWPCDSSLDRPRAAGLRDGRARRAMGLRRRDLQRQRHAVRPLGDRRNAGRFRLGLFSRNRSRLSGSANRSADQGGHAPRHPRQPPCLGHDDHRGVRRGVVEDRKADLLHLRRTRCSRSPPTRRLSGSSGSTNSAASAAVSAIR